MTVWKDSVPGDFEHQLPKKELDNWTKEILATYKSVFDRTGCEFSSENVGQYGRMISYSVTITMYGVDWKMFINSNKDEVEIRMTTTVGRGYFNHVDKYSRSKPKKCVNPLYC